ncbi:MAG TPA: outer membrane beta-barrel protein [Kofleriaceae bacterium]
MLVLVAGLGSVAAAQPGPPPAPPPPPADTTTTTTDPAPPDPTPPPQPQPDPRPMPVVTEEPVQNDRPDGFAIGLGLGYGLPTSLETPNRTSARVRLGSGLTFEPLLSIANTTETNDPADPTLMETEDKLTEFGLAVLVRLPVITHGHVDLEVLASAGFDNSKDNPDGDYNTVTTNTFGIGWGLGIGYWFSRHWQLSMSVTNPLVQYQQLKRQAGPSMYNTDSATTLGVIFVPQVTAMIHLYN